MTYRVQYEEKILNDISASDVCDAKSFAPWLPICTSSHACTPTAKGLVQIEAAAIFDVAAHARLEVAQPITSDVDAGSNTANGNACSYENPPYLAGISDKFELS